MARADAGGGAVIASSRAIPARRRTGSLSRHALALVASASMLLLGAAPHNKHFSHTRLVLDGTALVARVRIFKDDLEKALKRKVGDDAASKQAVAGYAARAFILRADDVVLKGEVLDQGGDSDGDQPVTWLLVQWTAPRPPKKIGVKDLILFDQYDDQQNLVILSRMPGDERRTLYFQSGDRSEQVISY